MRNKTKKISKKGIKKKDNEHFFFMLYKAHSEILR